MGEDERAALPSKEAFHSKLTDSDISDEDYEHAQNVWRTFNIQTMRGHHNLYMMSMLHRFPPDTHFFHSFAMILESYILVKILSMVYPMMNS